MALEHPAQSNATAGEPKPAKARSLIKKTGKKPAREVAPPNSRLARLYFGPPVLPGENKYDYFQMLAWVNEATMPSNIIETLFVKEIVDASLEIERLKHLTNETIRMRWRYSIRRELSTRMSEKDVELFVQENLRRGSEHFRRILALNDINSDGLLAEAYRYHFDTTERFHTLISAAEKRRRRAIRDIERYRERRAKGARNLHLRTLELQVAASGSEETAAN